MCLDVSDYKSASLASSGQIVGSTCIIFGHYKNLIAFFLQISNASFLRRYTYTSAKALHGLPYISHT